MWLSYRNKVVAIGAVSYYVDRFMTGRISKFTYGVPCNTLYDPYNPEHVQCQHKSFINAIGERRVPGHFVTMLSQVRHPQSFLGFSSS